MVDFIKMMKNLFFETQVPKQKSYVNIIIYIINSFCVVTCIEEKFHNPLCYVYVHIILICDVKSFEEILRKTYH